MTEKSCLRGSYTVGSGLAVQKWGNDNMSGQDLPFKLQVEAVAHACQDLAMILLPCQNVAWRKKRGKWFTVRLCAQMVALAFSFYLRAGFICHKWPWSSCTEHRKSQCETTIAGTWQMDLHVLCLDAP